jgi:hypothetical protein
VLQSLVRAPRTCLRPWSPIVSKSSREARRVWKTYLSNQDRGTHVRPSSAIVSELREHRRSVLLGRCHDPKTDDHGHEAEDMDAAEDTFRQRKVLGAEDVEGRYCNHCDPREKSALPSLRGVGGVIDHDQCLYQPADDERVYGDD